MQQIRAHVLICAGTGCIASGSKKVEAAFVKEITAKGLENEIKVVETGCHGFCEMGPIVIIYPEGGLCSYPIEHLDGTFFNMGGIGAVGDHAFDQNQQWRAVDFGFIRHLGEYYGRNSVFLFHSGTSNGF